jgi:hypothetical protein
MSGPARFATPAKLNALKWRCIGPSRGGRVIAVGGDPKERATFYFGACAGGVWKTTDGGVYWSCVTDGFFGSAAIGSIAVAPSDPNVIYVGTGETTIWLDVSYGDGIYKSTDAGRSWTHTGLRDSKFIGRMCIHPKNPDLVYAAVLGDVFGPREERGVYRTQDGGGTWQKVLQRADTGAVGISIDPNNPRILFATLWQVRRNFWNMSSGGPGCGLFHGNPDAARRQPRSVGSLRPSGVAMAVAPGVGGGIRTCKKPDGTTGREYLDVGENPPNGAIVYYLLEEGTSGLVTVTCRDSSGAEIVSFRSDDKDLPAAKRPLVRAGLNRYVWDLKCPGPGKPDPDLAPPRNKPLAVEADPPSGPTVVPGEYVVELTVGAEKLSARFSVEKDPRLATTQEDYRRQFELWSRLSDSLKRVNEAVDRIRRLKRQLALVGGDLADKADPANEALSAIEGVLVDVHRQSDRDVLATRRG